MTKDIHYWVNYLKLSQHPEGGFFKETYRSEHVFTPEGYTGERSVSTSIYYMLGQNDFSSFHKLKSDEIWHYYFGDTARLHMIDSEGKYQIRDVGPNPEAGEAFQVLIPANTWFVAETLGEYSLVGCTVAPGFDFTDFNLSGRETMLELFPKHREIILRFTR